MIGGCRGSVVVVPNIARHDERVGLRRQWSDYVREHVVSQPGNTIIDGLAAPHSVTRNPRVPLDAAGALACVIPRREEGATRADRNVRLPLRTGSSIGVQLERRTEGRTAVGRANII